MSGGSKKIATSAAGPAAGYYYQIRYSLFRGLQLHPKFPTGSISIELLDDVSLVTPGVRIDSQLKHSIQAGTEISSSAPAIWRTLAIWLDLLNTGLAERHEFHFVTTMRVSSGDALENLRPEPSETKIQAAISGLETAAKGSTNAKSKKDRERFLSASAGDKLALIKRIRVLDETPDLADLSGEIEDLIHYAADPRHLVELREDLEGWWASRLFNSWTKNEGADVLLEEIAQKVWYLKDKYKPDELPLDVEETECGEILEERRFIRQIRLVTSSDMRLKNAQKSFLRCATQRSKWIREFRIDPEELDRFDDELHLRWKTRHAQILDDLPEPCSDTDFAKSGRDLLGWAELSEVPLRTTKSVFLTSGSYHALADAMKLGWHPNYEALLKGEPK